MLAAMASEQKSPFRDLNTQFLSQVVTSCGCRELRTRRWIFAVLTDMLPMFRSLTYPWRLRFLLLTCRTETTPHYC